MKVIKQLIFTLTVSFILAVGFPQPAMAQNDCIKSLNNLLSQMESAKQCQLQLRAGVTVQALSDGGYLVKRGKSVETLPSYEELTRHLTTQLSDSPTRVELQNFNENQGRALLMTLGTRLDKKTRAPIIHFRGANHQIPRVHQFNITIPNEPKLVEGRHVLLFKAEVSTLANSPLDGRFNWQFTASRAQSFTSEMWSRLIVEIKWLLQRVMQLGAPVDQTRDLIRKELRKLEPEFGPIEVLESAFEDEVIQVLGEHVSPFNPMAYDMNSGLLPA